MIAIQSIVISLVLCLSYAEVTIKSFTTKEIECLKAEKVYYKNDGKCYDLKVKGPCENGQWLILDKNKITKEDTTEQLRPVCKKEPCESNLEFYWAKTKTCIKQRDKENVCGNVEGINLGRNVYGEGECACKPYYERKSEDDQGPCYPLYYRGPCSFGMIFGFRNNNTNDAQCIPDVCHNESIKRKRNKSMSANGVLAQWYDGKCYELGTDGPCPSPAKFNVHSILKTPECISHGNQIFQFGRPDNCYGDEKGNCQKVVTLQKNEEAAEKFIQELFQSVNSLRKRRWTNKSNYNKF